MYAIGVDIGGTKTAAGVVDADGTVLARLDHPTARERPAEIERCVVDMVTRLRADHPVDTVGVAAAGFVATDRNTVLFAPNIAWRDHPLGRRLSDALFLPVTVDNDANSAGWAEYRYGAGRDATNMVMLTIGTGVGGALIVNSDLVRGNQGTAAEVGHINVVPGGLPCGCGGNGCWEQYASGRALTRRARAVAAGSPERANALLTLAGGDPRQIHGSHVTQAAQCYDQLSIELLTDLGTWLGTGAAVLTTILDPDLIVVGGGVAAAGNLLLGPARVSFATTAAPGWRHQPPLVTAHLNNDAGIIGAADLARTDHPSQDWESP